MFENWIVNREGDVIHETGNDFWSFNYPNIGISNRGSFIDFHLGCWDACPVTHWGVCCCSYCKNLWLEFARNRKNDGQWGIPGIACSFYLTDHRYYCWNLDC